MAVNRLWVAGAALLSLTMVAGCGSKDADTDTSTAGLKAPLPIAKPGTVVDPPDPSKQSQETSDIPGKAGGK